MYSVLAIFKKEHLFVVCLTIGSLATASAGFIYSVVTQIAPCPLCLLERLSYLANLPFLIMAYILYRVQTARKLRGLCYFLVSLCMLANIGISIFHLGVHDKIWTSNFCSNPLQIDQKINSPEELFAQLNHNKPSVSCTEETPKFLGLSLIWWNLFIAVSLGSFAFLGGLKKWRYP